MQKSYENFIHENLQKIKILLYRKYFTQFFLTKIRKANVTRSALSADFAF